MQSGKSFDLYILICKIEANVVKYQEICTNFVELSR